jgi:hypothetical protein
LLEIIPLYNQVTVPELITQLPLPNTASSPYTSDISFWFSSFLLQPVLLLNFKTKFRKTLAEEKDTDYIKVARKRFLANSTVAGKIISKQCKESPANSSEQKLHIKLLNQIRVAFATTTLYHDFKNHKLYTKIETKFENEYLIRKYCCPYLEHW